MHAYMNFSSSDYRFTRHDNQDCLGGQDLYTLQDINDEKNLDKCKDDCANNNNCGAVVHRGRNCWLKPSGCKDDLSSSGTGGTVTYLR